MEEQQSDNGSPPRGRLAVWFGVTPDRRREVLASIIRAIRDHTDRTGYWFQLILATGIATLGLVLDSTGVVIGAMLVAPLMGPIVQLAMGFVIGSSFVVMHSAARVLASVAVVVAGSWALAVALPFHEVTREVAARASPTALDLGVAAFCALAGGFSTIRPGAETAATAAGTSIGISLVPPLCVVGFGLGVGARPLVEGAALLFVANLSAILFFCALFFALLGFRGASPEAPSVERPRGPVDLATRGARSLLGREYGTAMRVVLPLILLAVVFVPLRRALLDVTWEVRTRTMVRAAIDELIPQGAAVQTHLAVTRGRVSVRVVMVDRGNRSGAAREALLARIERETGVVPDVEVIGVPDLQELRDVAATLRRVEPVPEAVRRIDLDGVRRRVEEVLTDRWPPAGTGPLALWRLKIERDSGVTIELLHGGDPLGPAAAAMLSREVSSRLGITVAIEDHGMMGSVYSVASHGAEGFLARLSEMVDLTRGEPRLRLCVRRPGPPPAADAGREPDAGAPSQEGAIASVATAALLSRVDPNRVETSEGDGWSASLAIHACHAEAQAPTREGRALGRDAGADAAGPFDAAR